MLVANKQSLHLEFLPVLLELLKKIGKKSFLRIAAEFALKRSSTQQIVLHMNLHMIRYQIQRRQAKPCKVVQQKLDFLNKMLTMIDIDEFHVRFIWSIDETHFHLNNFLN